MRRDIAMKQFSMPNLAHENGIELIMNLATRSLWPDSWRIFLIGLALCLCYQILVFGWRMPTLKTWMSYNGRCLLALRTLRDTSMMLWIITNCTIASQEWDLPTKRIGKRDWRRSIGRLTALWYSKRLQMVDQLNRHASRFFPVVNSWCVSAPKYLLPLIFVLLRRHLLLLQACTAISLDPRELSSSWENICQVLNVVNTRVLYLKSCFAQRNGGHTPLLQFAGGMFSEWEVYTVVDLTHQILEESPQVDSSKEISSDDLDLIRDFLRYPTGGPIPLTRPLPLAWVSTTGELLPSSHEPRRGMTLQFLWPSRYSFAYSSGHPWLHGCRWQGFDIPVRRYHRGPQDIQRRVVDWEVGERHTRVTRVPISCQFCGQYRQWWAMTRPTSCSLVLISLIFPQVPFHSIRQSRVTEPYVFTKFDSCHSSWCVELKFQATEPFKSSQN